MLNSIVLELQRDALNKAVPVADLLRKAYVVARKLKIGQFEKWVSNELNGYKSTEEVPEYRQIQGTVGAWNPYYGWQPIIFEEQEIEDVASTRSCGQAIAEIESLLESDTTLAMPLPSKAQQLIRKAIGLNTRIAMIVPRTALVRIADAVRTIILNWSMKLEEDGIIGEAMSFTSSERDAANRTPHNINNFYGPIQTAQIQQGVSEAVQISLVHQLDPEAIRKFLNSVEDNIDALSLEPDAAEQLRAEIQTLRAQIARPHPKDGAIKKSLSSLRRILEGAGGAIAAKLILQLSGLFGT